MPSVLAGAPFLRAGWRFAPSSRSLRSHSALLRREAGAPSLSTATVFQLALAMALAPVAQQAYSGQEHWEEPR